MIFKLVGNSLRTSRRENNEESQVVHHNFFEVTPPSETFLKAEF